MAGPKGILALAMGKAKPGGDMPPGDDEDMGGGMEGAKMTAAEDIIEATKSGDAAMLADAYQRMYDACAGGGGYEDED